MAVKAEAVGAECVRLEHLRPRVAVVGVDPLDDIRSGHVELLEVLGDENSALVQQRSHRSIEDKERLHRLTERGVPAGRSHTLCYPFE